MALLATLSSLPSLSSNFDLPQIGGGFVPGSGVTGGGTDFPGSGSGGGLVFGIPIIGGGSGSGSSGSTASILPTAAIGKYLSTALGIPAINWGRIAAFLLGLLLIAGGIYLTRPGQTIVTSSIRHLSEA